MAQKSFQDFDAWLRREFSVVGSPGPETGTRAGELGQALISYYLESDHSGWEGFESRDLTGIGRFLEDFVRYYTAARDMNRDEFKEDFFTGVVTFPGPHRRSR